MCCVPNSTCEDFSAGLSYCELRDRWWLEVKVGSGVEETVRQRKGIWSPRLSRVTKSTTPVL